MNNKFILKNCFKESIFLKLEPICLSSSHPLVLRISSSSWNENFKYSWPQTMGLASHLSVWPSPGALVLEMELLSFFQA